ncbi:zinc finger protein 33B-like [Sabethes cyaneus]|uniref:zinc finger protein 33B-like n=1 Tax=Sabethes cyaneus TaxID=53552 RepID=UPI00237DA70A|nr:zinc finger protein 33B-like [Sabethes cyaneus]
MTLVKYDYNHLMENFENICRFCLLENNCIQILNNGINESLIGASDFFVSKVDEKDGLPNKICQQCLKCVLDFAELEARCKRSYEVLQQIIEQRFEANEKNMQKDCPAGSTIFQEKQHFVPQQNCIQDQEEGFCDTSENTDSANKFHVCEIEDNVELQSIDESQSDIKIFECSKKTKTNKGKICPICGKLVSQLSKHMPTHSAVKRFTCEYCSKSFTHDTTLRKHIRSVHLKIKQYHCEICLQSFTDRSSLRYHDVVKHKEEKNFECTICRKSYYTSSGLAQHNSLNHEQRKFKCEKCGKMFAMKFHLKEHENTHSDARPHACVLCEKTFKRVKNLNEHMIMHKCLKI